MKPTLLLTGGNGFLGSHLLHYFVEKYHVVVLEKNIRHLARMEKFKSRLPIYDIENQPLKQIFEQHRIDVVVHTATNYGRNCSFSQIIRDNVAFAVELMETAQAHGTKLFVNTDTFINTDEIKYNYLVSYALSKKNVVEWMMQFRNQMRMVNIKLHHIFGENDNPEKFVTAMLQQITANKPAIQLTPGEQRRDFIYVENVVKAFDCAIGYALNKPNGFYAYEAGHGQAISVKEFLTMMKQAAQSHSQLQFGALPYRDNEFMNVKADNTSLQAIGWKPEVSVKQGIERVVSAWQKQKNRNRN